VKNTTPCSHEYKQYDDTFKRSVVELWLTCGKTVGWIVAELDISPKRLKLFGQQLAGTLVNGR
jgi:hypothetical protein